ncbi:hypothetical protein BGW39_003713 [Mortierella sp. 14UC]|nr:hypothetical protein BGW39_003713 [Mortierella sp. 14UC]
MILKPNELITLACTNRRMYASCMSLLYRDLFISSCEEEEQKIFAAMPCLIAFGRNTHHVRKLTFGPVELHYYYNCMLAHETINSLLSDQPNTRPPRPQWLPPPDNNSRSVVPLPTITNLRHLHLTDESLLGNSMGANPLEDCPYQLSDETDHITIVAAFCWLVLLNSRLRHLESGYDALMEPLGGRLFALAIAKLPLLMTLDITICRRKEQQFETGSSIFFSLCPSIRKFIVQFDEEYAEASGATSALGGFPGYPDWMAETRRQEPLWNLEELQFWDIDGGVSTDDILPIFAHCPNIEILHFPRLSKRHDHMAIGAFIGKECPKLRSLTFGQGNTEMEVEGPLLTEVMNTLRAQQVESIFFYGSYVALTKSSITLAALRHSITLHSVHIEWTGQLVNISIAAMLEECINLESLFIFCHDLTGNWIGLSVSLDDLLDRPWNVTKLTNLTLGITGIAMPDYPGKQHYHTRYIPITFTDLEREHFSRVEELYRRIGTLTKLTQLELDVVAMADDGRADRLPAKEARYYTQLAARGVATGLPDFNRHLVDLSKRESYRTPFYENFRVDMNYF